MKQLHFRDSFNLVKGDYRLEPKRFFLLIRAKIYYNSQTLTPAEDLHVSAQAAILHTDELNLATNSMFVLFSK